MKASKFIVLVGGIVGLIAFFLPAIKVTHQGQTVGVSAMQMVAGLDLAKDAVDKAKAPDVAGADGGELKKVKADASSEISKVKGIVMGLFAPALLLVIIGGVGAMRRRFGRGLGSLSLLLGLISLAIGALIMSAASEGGDTSAGIAITMLVVTGIAGALGGLMALIKPDRGMATG